MGEKSEEDLGEIDAEDVDMDDESTDGDDGNDGTKVGTEVCMLNFVVGYKIHRQSRCRKEQ